MDRQRRKILELGLGGFGLLGGAIACSPIGANRNHENNQNYPKRL